MIYSFCFLITIGVHLHIFFLSTPSPYLLLPSAFITSPISLPSFLPPLSSLQSVGVVPTGIGIWGLVVGSEGNYDVITGHHTISAAAVLLTAGVVTLVIAVEHVETSAHYSKPARP